MSLGLNDLKPRRKSSTSTAKASLKSNVAKPWSETSALQTQARNRRQFLDLSAVMNEEWLLISHRALPWIEVEKVPVLLCLHNKLRQFEADTYAEWRATVQVFSGFFGFEPAS